MPDSRFVRWRRWLASQPTRLREGALTPTRTPQRPPAPATLVPLARTSEQQGRSECCRTDCERAAVFEVIDLRVEFSEPDVPGPTSYVLDGEPARVCEVHLAEYLAVANDGDSGLMLAVKALKYGPAHLIAEGLSSDVRYA